MRDLYASVALAYTIPIAKGNSGDKTAISKPQGHQTLEDMAVPKKVSSQTSCLEWFSSVHPIHRDCYSGINTYILSATLRFWRPCTSTSGFKSCLRPLLYLYETSSKSTSLIRDLMIFGFQTPHNVGSIIQKITSHSHSEKASLSSPTATNPRWQLQPRSFLVKAESCSSWASSFIVNSYALS